jgi:subtilisin family serine protease
LSVGALAPEADEHCIAEFSNYGKKEVDVFAPGVFIYSTTPDGTYDYASGTSMASPVVAGMAALIRSRHPDLSAVQVKKIIMDSSRPLPAQVIQPGTFDTVRASDMCVTGGMVDVPGAMQRAAATKGKAKTDRRIFSADGRPMPAKGPKA